ncbi:MAG: PTS transporter subunit EIIC [Clostridiales bacterium]|jgi:PTS system cellobiose-specific IIC component|nr:PTS transporter subunit EIIC [Clostridiales bacterium]
MKGNLIETIQAGASKIQQNKWMGTIAGSMASLMAILMTGAIASLINGLPLGGWYTGFLAASGLGPLLSAVVSICNLTAVFMGLAIGYGMAKQHGDNPFQGALLTLLCFFLLTPIDTIEGTAYLKTSWLGAQGIFSAMLTAIAATFLFHQVVKRGWKIKMPEVVPEFVSKPFEAMIPVFITVIPFIILRAIFQVTTFGNFHQFIYSMVATPLLGLGNSFPAHLIALLVACILWWLGIHGTLVVFTVMSGILSIPALANLEAFNAGQPLPYFLSMMTFFLAIQFMGGPGCLFGLYIDMVLFAKSERYKALGKVAFAPGMFNIIEPVVYGYPIVLNPLMAVPFIATPLIAYTILYILMRIGIVGVPVIMLQVMTIPGPIAGFLLGGGLSLGFFLIIACAISVVIYFPFFKASDAMALKEEREAAAQEAAAVS